ncbi:MAG TPA: hypothetical protein VD971_00075 [Phycisphaerales bacterium]|nr:hypothetical protein [Phycisphaerales bacterium]
MHAHAPSPSGSARGRAFTMVELLMSVAVLALLIGLLIVGIRAGRRAATNAVQATAATDARTAVEQFRRDAGFLPPLVKDRSGELLTPAVPPLADVITTGPQNALNVYRRSVAADAAYLRTPQGDLNGQNPFIDFRFSEVSLGAYIVGAVQYPYGNAITDLPMDGVDGAGMYPPARDGTFEVPRTMLVATADRKRTGRTIDSYIKTNGSLRVFTDPARPELVYVRDVNDIPVRYYFWLRGREEPAGSGRFIVEDADDINMPNIVGRRGTQMAGTPADRDLDVSVELREASWAIVAAGPNRAFGDEELSELQRRMGVSVGNLPAAEERRLRLQAEKDNIVKVGSES